MHWCRGGEGYRWQSPYAVDPCVLDTAGGAALAAAAAAAVGLGVHRARRAARRGLDRAPGAAAAAAHAWQLGAAVALLLLHLAALAWLADLRRPAPYAVFSHAASAAAWAAAAGALAWARRARAHLALGPLAAAAAAAYTVALANQVAAYAGGAGFSPAQRAAALAGSAVMWAAAAAAAAAERAKRRALAAGAGADGADGAEPLLPGGDVEGGRPPKPARTRSWVALLAIAARYMWPRSPWLRARAAVCVGLVAVMRLLNLAVPVVYKHVVDAFAGATAAARADPPAPQPFRAVFLPWVAAYIALAFFQGGAGGGAVGLVANLRSYLWIPISQESYRRACLDVFSHALGQDLDFHLKRKTGELLRVMDRGTASIQQMLSTFVFAIGPAVFDIAAASAYIALRLQPWIAAIVFVTLSGYIPMTIVLTEWRGKFRRELNRLDNERSARATDALLNYETVKLFGAEALERRRFSAAIAAYQAEDYRLSASMNALNVAQSLVVFTGLAAGLAVCAAGVAAGDLTVGDAVLFVTLMQQLYAPLNFFGTYYRMIQQSMIDMENMFELLEKSPKLADAPGARPLALAPRAAPRVALEDVHFSYAPGAPVLRGVTLAAEPGTTLAVVGPTGAGKSTLLRLLLRLYDPTAGRVLVAGQDAAKVTQASLRAAIAVVPQDTVLFNDTIRFNIAYGRPGASDAEVEAAADAAAIGDAIRSRFPAGFETLVGERGLRLSGGEKQRVAFARAALRDAPILILDEATSALDSHTEAAVQAALRARRADRTVLIVAHRLSTVMDADKIVVLVLGEVAEQGTHAELLAAGGVYASMWRRQQESAAAGGGGAGSAAASVGPASRAASYAALQGAGG